MTRRDRVFASDATVAALRGQLTSTLVAQHRTSRVVCLPLRRMQARGFVGVVSLVDPVTIGPLVYRAISAFAQVTPPVI